MKLIFKRILFYFISFTWGFITSFIGLLGIALLAPFKRVHAWHGRLYGICPACFGEGWGFEMGCFWFVSNDCYPRSTGLDSEFMGHEAGHGLQNCVFGPFMLLIVSIPSMIRFWYRELHFYRKGKQPTTGYDDIWFEGTATALGKKFIITDKI